MSTPTGLASVEWTVLDKPRMCRACGAGPVPVDPCPACRTPKEPHGPFYKTNCATCTRIVYIPERSERGETINNRCPWCAGKINPAACAFSKDVPDLVPDATLRMIILAACDKIPQQTISVMKGTKIQGNVLECSLCHKAMVAGIWNVTMSHEQYNHTRAMCQQCGMAKINSFRWWHPTLECYVAVHHTDPMVHFSRSPSGGWELTTP